MLSLAMTVSLLVVPGAVDKIPSGEMAQLVEAVCGKGNVLTEHAKEASSKSAMQAGYGCKKCPSYTGDAGQDMLSASFVDPIPGVFTAAGRTETLVDLYGCEGHAAANGGTALLRKEKGTWRRISYSSGLRTGACLTLRRTDGTDLLVSQGGDVAQGYVLGIVHAYRFNQRGTLANEGDRLASSMDTLGACPQDGTAVAMDIRSLQARDMNGDGKKDVVMELSAAFARVQKKEDDPCLSDEDQKKYLKPKKYQLIYLFDGNSLTPSPETGKALRDMNAERSDILGEPIDEQSARGFIEHWLTRSEDNGKLRDVMWNYADVVDFYKLGMVSKDAVRRDKQKYYQRWPKRKYELKSFKFSPGDRRHEAKVAIVFSYEIANDKKTLKGEAKAMMVLQSNDEGIRIVGEKEQ